MTAEAPTPNDQQPDSEGKIAQTLRQGFLEAASGFSDFREIAREGLGTAETPYFGTTLRIVVDPNRLEYSTERVVNGSKEVETVQVMTGEKPEIGFVRTVTRLTKSAEPRIRPEPNKDLATKIVFGKLIDFKDKAARLRF